MRYYTHDLIKYAHELGEKITVDYDSTCFKYSVTILNVWYQEQGTVFKLAMQGVGFTIEDSCCDYLRKCRGQLLVHIINNKQVSPV